LGKVVYDPELHDENGVAVVCFELEVEEFRRDSNGEKVRTATYLSFEAWDSAALAINKYAQESTIMAVEAIARNVQDEDSEEYLDTYFRVTNFKILNVQ